MRAGRLRHLVTAFEDVETGTDTFGTPTYDVIEIERFWASVEPLRGNELFESRQVFPETTHRIICRSRPNLTADMRLDFNGRTFELMEPPRDRDERGIEQEFMVKERTA